MVNAAAPSVVTFGEVMLRLAAPDGLRLASARTLDATFGRGGGNVVASLAGFHVPSRFVTRVPANDLGEGGARVIEFTDRGHGAWGAFTVLAAQAARHDPEAILGAGSIRDPESADRFIASAARGAGNPRPA